MQKVKAHELRQRDEKALIDELTKYRVIISSYLISCIERISSIKSKQSFSCSSSQISSY